MLIGIPKEPSRAQTLVASTPNTVTKLVRLGYDVCVESGAGESANYPDDAYAAAGARIVSKEEAWGADIVACMDLPPDEELSLVNRGATLIARMDPWGDDALAARLADMGVTALALDAVPRISRAQALDVRSSMMNVAGYRAVIEAAGEFGSTFGGQVTAAGKTQPARVYVIGVGVAGLAAIGTAISLGAQVYATDVRPEVADQVESLGGTFVKIPVRQHSANGYAKELDEEQQRATQAVYAEQAALSDVVITTAAVPGHAAPLLLTAEAVFDMKPGSVVVDMGASELGGNCELSQPGEVVTTESGVKVIGYTDLPARMPSQASQLFGQNIVNLLKLATPDKDGVLALDMSDEVQRGMCVALGGEVMWPPPPVSVSAALPASSSKPKPKPEAASAVAPDGQADADKTALARHWWKALLGALVAALVLCAPVEMASHFVVFMLSCVVGFYVITNVTHSLHTPLMSETNAISGIIIVGALLQLADADNPVTIVLAFVAMTVASINIFGGFLVTGRMLEMFERSSG